jgi:putative ABC transport system ATP-binding protein
MEHVLETIDLGKTYLLGKVRVQALRGVNLRICEGELVILKGPSGCGKSTLLHILGAMARLTLGRARICGRDITNMSDRGLAQIRRQNIGFVFQKFNLLASLTARDNIEVARHINRGAANGNTHNLSDLVRLLGIHDKIDRKPSELSGGEQQRVAIARALVNGPRILLADEPTGSLDSQNSEVVMGMLRHLNRNLQQTVVLATHNADLAAYADRVIEMRDGVVTSGADL